MNFESAANKKITFCGKLAKRLQSNRPVLTLFFYACHGVTMFGLNNNNNIIIVIIVIIIIIAMKELKKGTKLIDFDLTK